MIITLWSVKVQHCFLLTTECKTLSLLFQVSSSEVLLKVFLQCVVPRKSILSTLCWSCHILAHKDIVLFFLKANECDCFPSYFFLQQFNILGSLGTNYTSEGQLRNSFQPRQLTCTATLFAEKKIKLRLGNSFIIGNGAMWWFRFWQRTSENRNSDDFGSERPFSY